MRTRHNLLRRVCHFFGSRNSLRTSLTISRIANAAIKIAIEIALIILVNAAIWYAFKISTFNSVAELKARWWLSTSESLLIASAIGLVIGLVGEWPDSESWKKKFAYKVAKSLVVIGCVGELLGDAGIYESSARLQSIEENAIKDANTKAGDAITRAADLEIKAANLNKEAAELRTTTSARPWTKEQFDAIQQVKGVVTDVGILWSAHCSDCMLLAMSIEEALVSAGAKIYGSHELPNESLNGTGVFVRLPAGSDLSSHPLVLALRKAELYPGGAMYHTPFFKIRTDIPVIFVGDRFPPILAMPYQPPNLKEWTVLPIEAP